MTPLWTPAVLFVILRYYTQPEDAHCPKAEKAIVTMLINHGLLTYDDEGHAVITKKGEVFVQDGLMMTPEPVWGMPQCF